MSLSPGVMLGPYEIVAPLGAGGMGEVWRARDTRLDRDVAIKVLPEAMAGDKERLLRFERAATPPGARRLERAPSRLPLHGWVNCGRARLPRM